MAHGDAREGKWGGNRRMDWVASTLHTTSEHGVSSITTADAHTSAASSRLNWRPRRFRWTRPFHPKGEIWFMHVCHHISIVLCQRCLLGGGVRWPVRRADNLTTYMRRLCINSGNLSSWSLRGLSRPEMGYLYLRNVQVSADINIQSQCLTTSDVVT